MVGYKLFCFGNPRLELDGQPVKLEMRKSLALLVYLRVTSQGSSRESLAALFWPEYDQQHAQANLRRALASLNKSLKVDLLEADREIIGLRDPSQVWLDVEEFLEKLAYRKTHTHAQGEPCPECQSALEGAIQLYRGDFLEGFNLNDCPNFDEWQFLQRESLRQEYGLALQTIVEVYESQSQWKPAIDHARRWLSLDVLNEPACRTLMMLYARSGQRSTALRQYEELARQLSEQVGQEPEQETRALYEQIRKRVETKRLIEPPARAASFPLLKTKLYIPTPPTGRVRRSDLVDRLAQVEGKALTIISAPAGFGKSTLLAEWIAQTPLPVAWLSLDSGDNDPYRFLAYIIAALESIHEDIGFETRQFMQSTQSMPVHILLASLINDLGKISEPYALALDDYQFITETAVHEVVAYLLDHLPVNLHLVMATRVDPPLHLGRLRAHGQLLELRTQDLRFNFEETTEFLNKVMRLGLSTEDTEALEARTEGWIVGLKMAALSLEGRGDSSDFIRAFSGSHRYVLDYLVEEVLKRQPAHIQTFLLETSILEKLNGSLCDALIKNWGLRTENSQPLSTLVSPFSSSQAILEYLEKSNLFLIPLDENKQWYRYHHLFADLLRSRLQQVSAERVNALHLQASQWLEDQGLLNEAVDHALLSKDYHRSANLIDTCSQTRFLIDVFTAQTWIQQIPEEIIRRHPWIHVTQSWIWLSMGKLEKIEARLEQAEDCLRNDIDQAINTIETQDIRGHIAMLRAYLAFFRGDPEATIEQGSIALQNVNPANNFLHSRIALQLGESYFVLGELHAAIRYLQEAISLSTNELDYSVATIAYFRLGSLLKAQGELTKAEELYQQNLQALKEMGGYDSPMLGKPEVGLGDLLRERGQLDAARELLSTGHKHNEQQGQPYDLVFSYIYQACLYQALGKEEQALELLSQAEPLFLAYTNPPVVRVAFECYRVSLWLRLGKLDQAEQWVSENQLDCHTDLSYANELKLISLARVLITQGRLIEAQELLNRLASAAEAGGRNGRLIEILVLLSLALQANGNITQAFEILSKSLELAEPEGYQRIFLDDGEPMIELLKQLRESNLFSHLKDYVNRLLEAYTPS